jgi:hypothetical protein
MFFSEPLQRQYGRRQVIGRWQNPRTGAGIARRYGTGIDVEVDKKGTKLLPEDGIVLSKHVAAIVKKKNK